MSRPPNFLLVLTTQWRAMSSGFGGSAAGLTPELDAMADTAEVFTQAVTPHPFGPFARAALLTEKPSPQNGVRDYFDPLPEGSWTLAHLARDRGYGTSFFGKWHLSRRNPAAPLVGEAHARMSVPEEARGGFEFWEGFESGFLLNNPWLHGTRLAVPELQTGYQSRVLCARAAEWLAGQGGRPWFSVVSLEAPHPPYDAPAPVPPLGSPVLAPNVPADAAIAGRALMELQGYHRHVRATEAEIAALVRNVRIQDPNTVIIVTSVHGDMHGAHGLFRKGWPHEESIRIPWLVFWPEQWAVTQRNATPVSLSDLGNWFRAVSERRRWTADPQRRVSISMPSVVQLPLQCDRVWSGWRTPTEKRIFNADGSPWLHFDLARDPWELNNLVAPGPSPYEPLSGTGS